MRLRIRPLALAAALTGCGPPAAALPDYSEWLAAGVDPVAEADALSEGLARAGFQETRRIATDRWVALEARTDDGRRAIRVTTRIGAALVLDSHEPDRETVRHGAIELPEPPLGDRHDIDGDGHDEIVIGARVDDRTCLLPFRLEDDDTIRPVPPDLDALGPDACVERLEDLDRDGRLEGIAVVRIVDLSAGEEPPAIEAPLLLDTDARLRAGVPPVAWLEAQRAEHDRALGRARADHDALEIYRLAIELAALARLEGASTETQLGIFDRAIAGAVWPSSLAADVVAARTYVAQGWSFSPPPPPAP